SFPVGTNIRPAGEDVPAGQLVLRAGRRLRPGDIALLAALGRSRLRCHPRPRVLVLSTGSELVAPNQPLTPGAIRDSNGPMLAALVRQAGAVPFSAGIVPDDRKSLEHAFESDLGHCDLLITSGGVSAGAHDHVRTVLGTLGEVRVTKVAMKPGMPQVWGRVRGVPVFGLPGNPVSSFVSFEVFVRPALRRLQGRFDLLSPTVTARLTEDVHSAPAKRTYLRVRLRQEAGGWMARLSGGQGSHQLSGLLDADGLAEIPEERTTVRAGEDVRVHLLPET
ncbi:MAG: molybdopterin molybdotransferase MoeA, partial [Actinomycetota bacterium]|nr:molybdopterin molybdotransferase MoeA [Actinomycetota bacterium]